MGEMSAKTSRLKEEEEGHRGQRRNSFSFKEPVSSISRREGMDEGRVVRSER